MTKQEIIPEFVKYIPSDSDIKEGILYVSTEFSTATHRCCCGCGMKVVTSLIPTRWKLKTNNGKVSLSPSIGNWNFPCKSHYFITNNQVRWARKWSQAEVEAAHHRENKERAQYFNSRKSIWKRIWYWLFGD